jgi:hypothetical protein
MRERSYWARRPIKREVRVGLPSSLFTVGDVSLEFKIEQHGKTVASSGLLRIHGTVEKP